MTLPIGDPAATPPDPPKPVWERLGYTNEGELERAVYHSRTEGRRLSETLADRDSRLAELDRQMPSAASARRNHNDELAALGIPTDSLNDFVNERLNAVLSPILKTNVAMNRVKAENPDFARFEPQWQHYLATHPEVNSRLQDALTRDPDNADFALEGAFARFSRELRAAAPNGDPAPLPTDAALPNTQGSGSPRAADAGAALPSRDELDMLRLRARRGDPRAQIELGKLAFGAQIHPELPPAR